MNMYFFVVGLILSLGGGMIIGLELSEHKTLGRYSGSLVKRDFNKTRLVTATVLFGTGNFLIFIA